MPTTINPDVNPADRPLRRRHADPRPRRLGRALAVVGVIVGLAVVVRGVREHAPAPAPERPPTQAFAPGAQGNRLKALPLWVEG